MLRHLRVKQRKFSVHKQRRHQRERQYRQPDRRRQGQQHTQAQTPVEQSGKLLCILIGCMLGQSRQQNRTERRTQNTAGQLHQAVGVIHPRNAARLQIRSENRVDHQRNLRHAHAQNRRRHLFHHAVDRPILKIQLRQFQKTQFRQPRQLETELQNPADKNCPSQRGNGRIKIGYEIQRKDDKRNIQKRRRKRRNAELMIRIQYRTDKGRQRNQ